MGVGVMMWRDVIVGNYCDGFTAVKIGDGCIYP